MRKITILFWLVSCSAGAAEYEDCILDKMPGVANDITARAIMMMCRKEYPRPSGVMPKKRDGWFDYSFGAECAAKKGKDTHSQLGGRAIFTACNTLYEKKAVNVFDQFDAK